MTTRNKELLLMKLSRNNGRPQQWIDFEYIFTVNKIVVRVCVGLTVIIFTMTVYIEACKKPLWWLMRFTCIV